VPGMWCGGGISSRTAGNSTVGGLLCIEVLRSTDGAVGVWDCGAFGVWLYGASGSAGRVDSGVGSAWRSRTFDGADGETGC
jgi:hypothetical protein